MRIAALGLLGVASAMALVGCAGQSEPQSSTEEVGQASQDYTVKASFTYSLTEPCSTAEQVAAQSIRAIVRGFGRYRPGLDLATMNGQVILTPNYVGNPYGLAQDLDGDGRLDGQAYCDKSGACGEIQLYLSLQTISYQTSVALENSPKLNPNTSDNTPNPNYDPSLPEFPWMHQFQTGALYSNLGAGFPYYTSLRQTMVMPHTMVFDHVSTVKNQNVSSCGADYQYHCYAVQGVTTAQLPTLVSQIQSSFGSASMRSLVNLMTEPAQLAANINAGMTTTLCFDPDGGGGDGATGGGSGAGSCADGSAMLSYTDQALGSCCSVLNPTTNVTTYGIWMRHPSMSTVLVCRLSDLAAGAPAATADSVASGTAPTNVTNWVAPATGWAANDTNTGHYWMVDLGAPMALHSAMFELPYAGVAYGYTLDVSTDNQNWTPRPVRAQNAPNLQFQDTNLSCNARFLRVHFNSLQPGYPAALKATWLY